MDGNMYSEGKQQPVEFSMNIIPHDYIEDLVDFMLWLSSEYKVEWTEENVCEFLKTLQVRQLLRLHKGRNEGKKNNEI